MMRIGSLFSGIGGLELGLEWAGVGRTVWQVEREPFCRAVLARHWPDAQRFDDVTTVGAHNLAPVEVICGGFPCQDISYAGKGAGLAGERSGLWFEFARIVREMAPRFVVVENVSALLTRGLDAVLGTLASLGYDAEWSCVRASDVGARHRRERVFVIAWRVDDADDARLEGRCVRGQRRADERLVRSAGSENMANAGRSSLQRRRGSGFVDGASRAGEGDTPERERDGHAAGCGCEDADGVEHSDGIGFGRRRGALVEDSANNNERRAGPDRGTRPINAGAETVGRLGRTTDGIPARLDVARPGEPQHEWEAPRVTAHEQDRAARLKALGNAVVPQVAEVVGRRLLEIARAA